MTDQDLKIEVQKRETGKAGRREVAENQVRGVIYGKSLESQPVIADYNTLYRLFTAAGGNQIIELTLDGESHDVLFKDVDYHPVTNRIRHFDMYAVTKGEKITVEVPIVLTGDAPAERTGYNVVVAMETVEVTTIPRKIPEQLEVSAETLVEIGDSVTIGDIKVADDIEILVESEAAIAKVEEVQELSVEEEGPTEMPSEDGEEGEAGEGGEAAEGDGGSDASEE